MTARTPLIAGNWKMHKTGDEAGDTAADLARRIAGVTGREVMIAPPFTALAAVKIAIAGSIIGLGGQNLHWESSGAFTGEISGPMLTAAGCTHVIIGHSERRQFFGETDETVNKKIQAARAANLVPVMCIGETEAQREAEQTFSVLDKQIRNGLQGFALQDISDLVLAYEPVWAIGTGKTASREQAQEAHAFIRSVVEKLFGGPAAAAMRILYGGSVKPSNIADLMAMDDIDGALVGGASLEAATFADIVTY
ncbi:triose-phosphate isomerase [Desulfosudis oleivorans]|uniref:Triosephosphate isomerase n=1 Tax=Desulfosudis oleivorans (strain DSM 6200 / JCM 39069 / Hxd3) TaxID=96561 RepID=A8ZTP5_DESOH|nr:triose-phosphate isomerase [Desulfosudis oleivorans]ABW66309.1 Triose-phosphate isomerase [Desulfosudis oleivorans Hxd3]